MRVSFPSISLVISVYNKPENLRLVLLACAEQSFRDFEVIIADDGSDDAIREVVEESKSKHLFPIHRLWQEDRGWRKNRILNEAICTALAEYLVFIDGDCVPHHRFLEDHWMHREENILVGGRRAEMSARWSGVMREESIRSHRYERIGMRELLEGLRGKAAAVEAGFRFEWKFLSAFLHPNTRGLLGSNFSVYKKHLLTINGFDERYEGPGCGEDSDIEYRLSLIGVRVKLLRHRAIQFHLHHPATKTSEDCYALFQEVKKRGAFRCDMGIIKTNGNE